MLDAFKNISQGGFEIFFAAGLTGWGIWLLWGKREGLDRGRLFWGFAVLMLMMLWRIGIRIKSSRYALGMIPFLLLGMGLLARAETYPVWLFGRFRRYLAVGVVLILAGIGVIRCVTVQKHQKDFTHLVRFLQQEAAQCEAPLFLCMNGEVGRLKYYSGLHVENGTYAPTADPLKGYAPWLNDRVYCIYSTRNTQPLCAIDGAVPEEVFRDKATKTAVYCWRNPYWPKPPPSAVGDAELSQGKIVVQEDFESPYVVLPGKEWKLLEARGLVLPEDGVAASRKLTPNHGHHLNDLHGAEMRVTGGAVDEANGLVLSGKHSFLISLPHTGGGFMLPILAGKSGYIGSLRFRGTPGSGFRMMGYGTSNPVTYAACRNEKEVYEIQWKIVQEAEQRFVPVIYVEQNSRIVFDDIVITALEREK